MPYRRITVLTVSLMALSALAACSSSDRQGAVASRGKAVMPFDLERTTHHFTPRADGLIQEVVADDRTDTRQTELVRQHLREEAERFKRGDFDDPARIHGAEMPGLRQLQAGAGAIDVRYQEIGAGASISFLSPDPTLVDALHQWGEAQVADHGRHAATG